MVAAAYTASGHMVDASTSRLLLSITPRRGLRHTANRYSGVTRKPSVRQPPARSAGAWKEGHPFRQTQNRTPRRENFFSPRGVLGPELPALSAGRAIPLCYFNDRSLIPCQLRRVKGTADALDGAQGGSAPLESPTGPVPSPIRGPNYLPPGRAFLFRHTSGFGLLSSPLRASHINCSRHPQGLKRARHLVFGRPLVLPLGAQ